MKTSFLNKLYIILGTISLISCANINPSEESGIVVVPELYISTPTWPDNLGLWSGVETEALFWKYGEEEIEIPMEEWSNSKIDLSTGGLLTYEARSKNGTLLLHGDLKIDPWDQRNGEARKIILKIHRVDFE